MIHVKNFSGLSKEIKSVKLFGDEDVGNKDIQKIKYFPGDGTFKLVWENWKFVEGNCWNSSNTTISGSDIKWSDVFLTNKDVPYWTDFRNANGKLIFKDYATKKINAIKILPHYTGEEASFKTKADISVSEDNVTYYKINPSSNGDISGTFTINYKQLGINTVKYVKVVMYLQNASFPDDIPPHYHHAPNIVVDSYFTK